MSRILWRMHDTGMTYAGRGSDFTCPSHDDLRPSLGIDVRSDQRGVVLNCSAGCTPTDVLKSLGLSLRDLYDAPYPIGPEPSPVKTTYTYQDADGNDVLDVVRVDRVVGGVKKKDFRQFPAGKTSGSVKGLPTLIYNLPEVLEEISAENGKKVWVVEGEKSVVALSKAGKVATCNPMGSGSWTDACSRFLRGVRRVTVVADRDSSGLKWAHTVLESIERVLGLTVASGAVRVMHSATTGAGDDIFDHLQAGFTLKELVPVVVEIANVPGNAEAASAAPVQAEFKDAVLSERLSAVFRHELSWTPGRGWLSYEPEVGVWRACTDVTVREHVRKYFLAWFSQEVKTAGEERLAALRGCLSKSKISNVATLLKGCLERSSGEFDAHQDHLNCSNGVVYLPTSDLLPHSADFFFTKTTGVPFVRGATHPDWDEAQTVLPREVMDYVLDRCGQAASGHQPTSDRVPVLQGNGANGKSTLLVGVDRALGDYSGMISDRILTNREPPSELMDLQGLRLAYTEELPEGQRLNMQRIKKIVGTPVISGRRLYQNGEQFLATHSLFISTNHVPIVGETDRGSWRRLELIAFPYTFKGPASAPADERHGPSDRVGDPGLRDRIRAGAHGQHEAILASLVTAARAWYERGRQEMLQPESVRAATAAWQLSEDVLGQFFEERITVDSEAHIAQRDYASAVQDFLLGRYKNLDWADHEITARTKNHELFAPFEIKKVRAGLAGLSRPRRTTGVALPKQYNAMLGLAFKVECEGRHEAGK